MCNEDHYRPILNQLQRCKRNRRGWESLCPVHEADGKQHRPSFFCQIGRTGALLVQCSACRCTVQQVADALGLRLKDFFPPDESFTNRSMSEPIATYDYFDENEVYQYTICRYDPKNFRVKRVQEDGSEEWGLGDRKTVLYKLPELMKADPKSEVYICEGEKDVDRLRALGLVATCNPFGAGKWRPQFADKFVAKYVVVIADNDEPGERHAQEVVNSLIGKAKGIKLVRFNGGYPKGADAVTYLENGGSKEDLKLLIKQLPLITEPFVIQPLAAAKPTTQSNTEGQRTDAPERRAAPPRTDAPATEGMATDGETRRAAPPNGSGGAAPTEPAAAPAANIVDRIVTAAVKLPLHQRMALVQHLASSVSVELAK